MAGADEVALHYLLKRGFEKETLEYFKIGIVVDPPVIHSSYKDRISFPYITANGIVTIRFRRHPNYPDDAKFLSLTGEEARLFNTRALLQRNLKRIYICEGETDTMMAHQCGLPAVGVPGVTNWNEKIWPKIFRDIPVTVLADNDDSGEGQKLAKLIYSSLGGCDIILMEKGKDVSEYVSEYGKDQFLQLVGVVKK